MNKVNLDLIVGIFMIAGFLAFAYLSMQFGEFSIFTMDDYYRLSAEFDNVTGLKEGAAVEIAGVNVGRVAEISLAENDRARVGLLVRNGVAITEDAIASIRTQGLIGDKYIKIIQGGAGENLAHEDMIFETESAIDIEELVSKYIFESDS